MPFAPQRSQFSDPSIPMSDALSLCGPAAALVFAQVTGRTPTLKEARDLAKEVGWTAQNGMAGAASEQGLLRKLGVESELTPTADWSRVTGDVRAGKPVIISTPRHYFTVSDVDDRGRYYVGTSGTDLKGGSEWLTADQIAEQGRGVNGVLHLTSAATAPSQPRAQQQFLDANNPGGQDVPASAGTPAVATPRPPAVASRPDPTDTATSTAPGIDWPSAPDDPTSAQETAPQTTLGATAGTGLPAWLRGQQAQDAYARHVADAFGRVETPIAPSFVLPGAALPGFRQTLAGAFRLPGGF